jgi:serine/threonine-protein kinase
MIRRGMRGVHAKVLDFGIARLMDAGTKLTVAGAIAGTPRYMSPEQVEGREADHRADIYSLGIVLFETLTGRQPFDGQTIAEILRRQAIEPMPHLTELAPELDYPDLDAVIQKACAKKRDERWADMLTFANALSQATPTAAHLGLSPLQKSGVSHASLATPRPGPVPNTTPASTSGVAVPGTAVDQSSTEQTIVKLGESSSGLKAPVVSLATSAPLHGSGTASSQSTQVEGLPQRAPDLSMSRPPEPVAPSSKAPMIAALLAVVVVLGAGAAWFASQKGPEPVKPVDPVVKVDPVKAPAPVKDPVVVADPVKPPAPGQEVTEAFVAGLYAQGQAAFETGNLDNAETFLSKVPESSPLKPKAEDLLVKIKTINETMSQADRNRANGRCDLALPQYGKVLGLNSRFAPANEGAGRCRAANVSNQME